MGALIVLGNILGKVKPRKPFQKASRSIVDCTKEDSNYIETIRIGPDISFSLGPIIIPFLQHNDRTRALIGSNILRQALPNMNTTPARVSTIRSKIIRSDRYQAIRSIWAGLVSYASANSLIVESHIYPKFIFPMRRTTTPFFLKKLIYSNFNFYIRKSKTFLFCSVIYVFCGVSYSNQATLRLQRPSIYEGEWVKVGSLLGEGIRILGKLAIGNNILLGYLPWDGYNFEDGIVATEILRTKEVFTSVHVEEWEASLRKTRKNTEVFVAYSYILSNAIIVEPKRKRIYITRRNQFYKKK